MTALSYGQQRLWYLSRLDDGAPAYNVPVCWRLSGPLDVVALGLAVDDVVGVHEALRTVYDEVGGATRQTVLAAPTGVLQHRPLAGTDLAAAVARVSGEPFDLVAEVPVRAFLFTVARDDHALLLVFDHIAVDGRSLQIIARDLEAFYTARLDGRGAAVRPSPTVTYRDFASAQRTRLGTPDDPTPAARALLDRWRARLRDLPDEMPLPVDRRRADDGGSADGAVVATGVDAHLHRAAAMLARRERCSVFMLLHAVTALLLTRLGCGPDICLGTVTAGRTRPEYDDLVGFCVNTLALRVDTGSGEGTFRELLRRVRTADLEAFADQELPFEWLVAELAPPRQPGRHPLFQVMITAQGGGPGDRFRLPGTTVERTRLALPTAKFDLTFAFEERPDAGGVDLALEYRTALFDRDRIELLAGQFDDVLRAVVAEPDAPLGPILAASRRESALVSTWNATGRPPPARTSPELFLDQAARTPDRVAIEDGARVTTFAALERSTARLADRLRAAGAATDRLVALCLPVGADAAVAVLATWRSGGAVLPLDPDDPDGLLARTLAATEPVAVIVSADHPPPSAVTGPDRIVIHLRAGHVVRIDGVDGPTAAAGPASGFPARSLSHLILTSGTTGTPKGVLSEHAGLADHTVHRLLPLCADLADRLGRPLRVALSAPLVFDVVLTQLLALLGGHTVVTVPAATRVDPRGLLAHGEAAVDLLDITTAQLDVLAGTPEFRAGGAPGLLVFGGEGCPPRLWRTVAELPATAAYNVYGVTECSIDSTVAEVVGATPSLGRPHVNARVELLDRTLVPVPIGAVGEICLGGLGVARGYHGRPGATAERFVPDPSGAEPGARLYRTGDRGRFHADGRIAFLGRDDAQTKIRGRRVELEEIDHVVSGLPGVDRAAVVLGPTGAPVAFCTIVPGAQVDPSALRVAAARRLPAPLVPTAYHLLDRLPLTGNGKLDRARLADRARRDRGPADAPVVGLTPVERQIADLWTTLLRRPVADPDRSFFELGGHSLLALRLSVELEHRFGTAVPLHAVVSAPTVREQARLVTAAPRSRPGARSGAELVRLRASDTTPATAPDTTAATVLVHPVGGTTLCYRELLAALDPVGPVYGLQRTLTAPCPDDLAVLGARYAELIAHELRGRRVVLVGWSLGGVLAHATAARLIGGACAVELVLVDSYPAESTVGSTPPEAATVLAALAGGAEPADLAGADELVRAFGVDPADLAGCDEVLRGQLATVWAALLRGHDRYRPQPVPVHAVAAVSDRAPDGQRRRAVAQWRPAVATLDVVPIAGDHLGVLSAPGVSALASIVTARAAAGGAAS